MSLVREKCVTRQENKNLRWGERLARLRAQTLVNGEPMLQEEAARRAGTARETWVRWEARTTPLPHKTLPTIAHALGLTLPQLEEGLGGPVPPPLVDHLAMRTLRLLLSLDARTSLSGEGAHTQSRGIPVSLLHASADAVCSGNPPPPI